MLPAQGCLPSQNADKAPASQRSCSTSRYEFCWQLAASTCIVLRTSYGQQLICMEAIRPGGSLCWLPAMQT